MSTDKIKLIDAAFLLKNTPIEVINVKLPEFRTFELMNFQRGMFRVFFEEGYVLNLSYPVPLQMHLYGIFCTCHP